MLQPGRSIDDDDMYRYDDDCDYDDDAADDDDDDIYSYDIDDNEGSWWNNVYWSINVRISNKIIASMITLSVLYL